MKSPLPALFLFISVALAGCTTLFGPPPALGDTEEIVLTKRGTPTARYQDGKDTLLEYRQGPSGQYTFMARIGPDGKLISFEQVLTVEKFASIQIDQASKQDVLNTVGQPTETAFFPLIQMDVWSYRYKENDVWNSMMHIYFDGNSIVRRMENGRDPLYEPRDRD